MRATPFKQAYFHGTKASLNIGESIHTGQNSNYGRLGKTTYVYFSATLDAAIWGAELAQGNGSPRIYVVEPTGDFENDPELTDQRFPGNPTLSYRSSFPLKIVAELIHWEGHPSEQIEAMKAHITQIKS
jgi:hypothetical protein